ncbi:NAD(P)-binding protein [Podospora aff. communis PSN243]|uniref:NAD(P)-binding protein n=1 Tax=Podospora aff. communis PSN243 TaxID=3040156 RepID=A0AAV9H269_9PEZI|nr:NAD(P)-binding protein [Podospora aff. communis PSN243]
MHPMLRLALTQFHRFPPPSPSPSQLSHLTSATYIITGSNTGLGLETARHLISLGASRVILGVRNISAGETAKASIVESTSCDAEQRARGLERVDGVVCNAGVYMDRWEVAPEGGGEDVSMRVNVAGTMLLSLLVMPKLVEAARRFKGGVAPRMVFVVSTLGFTAKGGLDRAGGEEIWKGLNEEGRYGGRMDFRHGLTKLVEMYAVREFTERFAVEETGVVVNMVCPGLCATGLARDANMLTRAVHGGLRASLARTAEEGSRAVLNAIFTEEETHGKHLAGCAVGEDWIPSWMTDEAGQRTQKQIWKELVDRLEASSLDAHDAALLVWALGEHHPLASGLSWWALTASWKFQHLCHE